MNYILKDESALFFECGYSCDNALLLKISLFSFKMTVLTVVEPTSMPKKITILSLK